jgi:DnaJ family protein A protein 5
MTLFVYVDQILSRSLNSHLQSLTKFVRSRDPRYKSYREEQTTARTFYSTVPDEDSGKQTRPKNVYTEQDWQKVDTRPSEDDLEWATVEGNDLEEWECVACVKKFKSEAAWGSHERSKKHSKQVERLRKEMLDEEFEFSLDQGLDPPVSLPEDHIP